jgi:hypothetical protein
MILGLQPERIREIPALLELPVPGGVPPLWDGRAGERAAIEVERALDRDLVAAES